MGIFGNFLFSNIDRFQKQVLRGWGMCEGWDMAVIKIMKKIWRTVVKMNVKNKNMTKTCL